MGGSKELKPCNPKLFLCPAAQPVAQADTGLRFVCFSCFPLPVPLSLVVGRRSIVAGIVGVQLLSIIFAMLE